MQRDNTVTYLVLPDAAHPYLLARVRWPDVFQAVSLARPHWQEDPGLFDLPYAPNSVQVTHDQAATIASAWGVQLPDDDLPFRSEYSLIRRMPADWTNLSPAESRAWSLDAAMDLAKKEKESTAGGAPPKRNWRPAAAIRRLGRRPWRGQEASPSISPGRVHDHGPNHPTDPEQHGHDSGEPRREAVPSWEDAATVDGFVLEGMQPAGASVANGHDSPFGGEQIDDYLDVAQPEAVGVVPALSHATRPLVDESSAS
jgi:hypothetical protein